MPIYEFECRKCGKKIVITLSITEYEKKRRKCPKCGSVKLERIITSIEVKTSRKS